MAVSIEAAMTELRRSTHRQIRCQIEGRIAIQRLDALGLTRSFLYDDDLGVIEALDSGRVIMIAQEDLTKKFAEAGISAQGGSDIIYNVEATATRLLRGAESDPSQFVLSALIELSVQQQDDDFEIRTYKLEVAD